MSESLAELTETCDGWSGAQLSALCREAAMEPLRDEGMREALLAGTSSEPRAITYADFESALAQVRPSVSASELKGFEETRGKRRRRVS